MTETKLQEWIGQVTPINERTRKQAEEYLDSLAKPPGSLGMLEEIAARLAGITGRIHSTLDKRCVLVFAADNGVFEEGIASCPQNITTLQTINMLRGYTGVAVLAKQFGSDLWVTDVGINAELDPPGLIHQKIAFGTGNIAKGPAMSRADALKAIGIGIETAQKAAREGYKVLGVGEMGIGNTTTSSTVLCGLLGYAGKDAVQTVGRGAGLADEAYRNKISVVQTALDVNKPDKKDPVDVLAKVGGFDIAAMTGAFLGGAVCRVPMVADGFISSVAALCATCLAPAVGGYLFGSHSSFEKGYGIAAKALHLAAPLNLDMRLGEGSGCPLMFSVMDGACAVVNQMATFEKAQIETAYLENISKETCF